GSVVDLVRAQTDNGLTRSGGEGVFSGRIWDRGRRIAGGEGVGVGLVQRLLLQLRLIMHRTVFRIARPTFGVVFDIRGKFAEAVHRSASIYQMPNIRCGADFNWLELTTRN